MMNPLEHLFDDPPTEFDIKHNICPNCNLTKPCECEE